MRELLQGNLNQSILRRHTLGVIPVKKINQSIQSFPPSGKSIDSECQCTCINCKYNKLSQDLKANLDYKRLN